MTTTSKLKDEKASEPADGMFHLRPEFRAQVQACRVAAVVILGIAVLYREELDEQVAKFWSWLSTKWWFKHDSFEPVWATLSFSIWIDVFLILDYWFPKTFQGYLINPENRNAKETYRLEIHRSAGTAYLAPILTYDLFFPRRVLPVECPGFFEILVSVALALFVYDMIFFPIHVLFHKGPSFITQFHKRHHERSPLVSEEILRHSLVDGSMQVISNILTLNILRLHPLIRAIYNTVVTYLLTESHAGYDMPWMLHNLVPGGILGGPRNHEMHHRTGKSINFIYDS